MRLTTERITLLTSYGLTEYQARAYLALLENPMTSAGTLARLSRVPRNRLYGVLEDLQELSLVDIHLGEKRRYCARRFSNYLDKRKKRFLEKVEEIEQRRDYLDTVLEPVAPDDGVKPEVGTTRVLRGRRAIREEIERMIARAESSVVLVLTAGSAPRYEMHLHAIAEQAAKEGVTLSAEVWIPPECHGNGTAERLERTLPGCIRTLERPRHGIMHLVDGREYLYVHPIPDDRRGSSSSDFGLYTTNHAMTKDVVEAFSEFERTAERTAGAPEATARRV